MDAWASGQIGSKIWLAEKAEEVLPDGPWSVFLLGGWYGVLSQILWTRGRMNIQSVISFDLDPSATLISEKINDYWRWKGMFSARTADVNQVSYSEFIAQKGAEDSILIINTSIEHFGQLDWWYRVPTGAWVILQSTNMKHEEHLMLVHSADELLERFPISEVAYKGELFFDYKNESSFSRYMLIGRK